ncbi:hypothetical protein HAX54_032240 [Datura stramonium]|uniref:Uncharacterized protein n=1 Tax=Datura stramonium TaxID=4076 RepID=A0ABS8RLW8_DATST|nr:hypothetical protein [Datura stramonium]
MASIKPSYRYANAASSIDSLRSSTKSDPFPTELAPRTHSHRDSSRALTRSSRAVQTPQLGVLGQEIRGAQIRAVNQVEAEGGRSEEDSEKGAGLSALHKKFFKGVKRDEGSEKKKALTEAKANTRTLAMVLRSERELLREEIKSLKNSCIVPRSYEFSTSGTFGEAGPRTQAGKAAYTLSPKAGDFSEAGQNPQCLAYDLAEIEETINIIEKPRSSARPRSPEYDQEEAANSLEFSSENTIPGSPDDMFPRT